MSVTAIAWMVAVGVWLVMAMAHVTVTRALKIPPSGQIKANTRFYLIFAPIVGVLAYWALGEADAAPSPGWELFTVLMFFMTSHGLVMAFYSALDHSVRIRLCAEFFQARQPLSYEDIQRRYGLETATGRRLGKILGSGYAIRDGNRFQLSAKGLRMGKILTRLKAIYEFT